MTTRAAHLVHASRGILLDFDGPVTRLLPAPQNAQLAHLLRQPLQRCGITLSPVVADTTDHLAVLRYAGTHAPGLLAEVEAIACQGETDAAGVSQPTDGAHDFIADTATSDRPIVIVSNNRAEAVHIYLHRFDLHRHIRGVVGREPHHPELMKPHPSLVAAALEILGQPGGQCTIIGDTVTDIQAGKTAGLRCIGLAKNDQRAQELAAAHADTVIYSMRELRTTATTTETATGS